MYISILDPNTTATWVPKLNEVRSTNDSCVICQLKLCSVLLHNFFPKDFLPLNTHKIHKTVSPVIWNMYIHCKYEIATLVIFDFRFQWNPKVPYKIFIRFHECSIFDFSIEIWIWHSCASSYLFSERFSSYEVTKSTKLSLPKLFHS